MRHGAGMGATAYEIQLGPFQVSFLWFKCWFRPYRLRDKWQFPSYTRFTYWPNEE